jgi:hypothetical protein
MLKNESTQNPMKPVPLRPSRLPDSGGIFTLSNGVPMEKILHSVQKVKQGKKIADCAVRTVRTDTDVASPYRKHVEGSYNDTWQVRTGHMAAPGSDMCQADLAFWAYGWTNPEVTRVTTGRVTCGTG